MINFRQDSLKQEVLAADSTAVLSQNLVNQEESDSVRPIEPTIMVSLDKQQEEAAAADNETKGDAETETVDLKT